METALGLRKPKFTAGDRDNIKCAMPSRISEQLLSMHNNDHAYLT